jgi:hypothetical protein
MRCTMYQHADVPVMSFPQCRIMISASYRHALSCCPTSLSPVISCHIDVSCPMLVLFPILSHLAHSFDAGIPKQLHHHVLHHTSSCLFPRCTPSFIAPCSLFVLLPSSQSPHLTSSPSYSSPHCTSPLIVPPAIILLIVPVTSSPLASSYPTIVCAGGEPVSGIAAQRVPVAGYPKPSRGDALCIQLHCPHSCTHYQHKAEVMPMPLHCPCCSRPQLVPAVA